MRTGTLVARNALAMLAAQAVTSVLSFIAVPLTVRALGTAEYGNLWLATSIVAFAALLFEWGQEGYIPFAVAQDPGKARELLAVTVVLRLLLAVVIAFPLEGVLLLLRYPPQMHVLVFLMYTASVITSVGAGAMAVVRGLERMGSNAAARIVIDSVHTGLIVLALSLGAKARGVALAEIAVGCVAVLVCSRMIWRNKIRPAPFTREAARQVLRRGSAFVLWGSIIALQPSLEAVLLSKLSSADVVGWFGASVRLLAFLLFPAYILGGAIGPTLARLRAQDDAAFARTVRDAVRAALLLGAPVATGAFVFASRGVAFVYGSGFERTADIVRVLSGYVIPLFLNVVLGTAIMSGQRRLAWALWKGAMVVGGAGISLFLIPWAQSAYGNGGLGAAGVTVGAECVLSVVAIALLGRSTFDLREVADVLRALAAAAAMAVAARLLGPTPFAVALLGSLLAYGLALIATGAIGSREAVLLRDSLRASRLGRENG
ncbi:MAG TPA: oligosaccharide flippase family protein [Myxococcales bacterium]|nr:oligosaccharide flippase family protein [Myxococcales bacterium]